MPVKRIKLLLLSVLRPNQRRNWHKNHAENYKKFLVAREEMSNACTEEIDGIKIYQLLEKEIRNAYWIYRSSPLEQTVLLVKLIIRTGLKAVQARFKKPYSKLDLPEGKEFKAVSIVSPATGVSVLISAAKSCFDKDDVVFFIEKRNSAIEKQISQHGFKLLTLQKCDAYRWAPTDIEKQFLGNFWRSSAWMQPLSFFQRVFLYLNTRTALSDLAQYRERFDRLYKDSGCTIFAGRPRTPFVNGAIVAGREKKNRVVFVSHTIWYKQPCPVGALYNLDIFSDAILMTNSCKKEIARVNDKTRIAVVGMGARNKPANAPEDDKRTPGQKLRIGMFLGVDDFIEEVIPELSKLDVEIYLKTRPPGKNASRYTPLVAQYENVFISDHHDYPMEQFCSFVDIIVGGYSNAVFHAARCGVPVIGYLTAAERTYDDFLRPALIPFEIASRKVHDMKELLRTVSALLADVSILPELQDTQYKLCEEYLPAENFANAAALIQSETRRG